MIDNSQNIVEKSKTVIDSQYFGSINYYKILFPFSNIEIEQYENYQKMSFRNRCRVAGSNGVVNLSVPLEKGRDQKMLIKDVRISYTTRWQAEQWRTIESCYSRAPFFEFYRDAVEQLISRQQTFLLDKNMAILEWVKQVLRLPGDLGLTDQYHKQYPSGITDFRNQLLPKNTRPETAPRYIQVFEDRIGFQPDLSVLDLLFCCGPHSTSVLSGR